MFGVSPHPPASEWGASSFFWLLLLCVCGPVVAVGGLGVVGWGVGTPVGVRP